MKKVFLFFLMVMAFALTGLFATPPEDEILLNVTKSYVKGARELGVKLDLDYDEKLDFLEKQLSSYKNKFENAEYVFYINEGNIFKASLMYQILLDLQDKYSNYRVELENNIILLNNYQHSMKTCLDKLENIQKRATPDNDYLKETKSLRRCIALVGDRSRKLQVCYERLSKLNDSFQGRLDKTEEIIEHKFQDLPSVRRTPLYNKSFWKIIFAASLHVWLDNTKHSFLLQLPKDKSEWFILLGTLILIVFPLNIILKKFVIKRLPESFVSNKKKMLFLKKSIFLLLFGFGVFTTKFYMSPLESQFFEMVALLSISMGILDLSWISGNNFSNKLKQPFTSFWALYAVSMFLRFSGAEGALIVLFQIPTLLAVFIDSALKMKKDYSTFDKNLLLLILLFCLACLGLSVYGYYCFVVVLILMAFLTFVGILLGVSFTSIANKCAGKEENISGLKLLLVVLGIPLIWIMLIGSFSYLIADLFHVRHLLTRYIYKEVAWQGIAVSGMEVIECIVVFFVVRTFVYAVHLVCNLKKDKDNHEIQHPLGTIIIYLLWAMYILFVLKIIGVDYTSIMVVLGGMSVGIGFALQHIVENFISGLILIFGKELRPGDFIELKNLKGIIIKVNIRSTVLRTWENTLITIPNSQILSSDVKNWSMNRNTVRSDVKIAVNFGEDIDKVKALLLEAANSVEQVVDNPAPSIILEELGEHSMIFSLRIWIKTIWKRAGIRSEVREKIAQLFQENSIKFAFHHLEISMNEKDSSEDKK